MNIITTYDNNNGSCQINDAEAFKHISFLASKPIEDLCNDNGTSLLIFPQSFAKNGDDVGKSWLCNVDERNMTIQTNNIMGFVGYKGSYLAIRSRFTNDENDYFLHYMLQKVFKFNLVDLDSHSNKEQIFDFLPFIFPYFLKKAMRQGLYKEYQTRKYNDSNVRGSIDIERYINTDIPFMGNIAYNTREFAFDNHVTELIRHTIEYIGTKPYGSDILSTDQETFEDVSIIKQATPQYLKRNRNKILAENIRPVSHPYFYEYRDLQRICVMILREEEIKYGEDEDEIHGILFDGAWLWEEYLNTILRRLGFTHARNKTKEHPIYIFNGDENSNKYAVRYPDFYKVNDFVLDAKYKGYGDVDVSKVAREDLHQIITYMWILDAHKGGFVFPLKSDQKCKPPRSLHGISGKIGMYGLNVSQIINEGYSEFCKQMNQEEEDLVNRIKSCESDNY